MRRVMKVRVEGMIRITRNVIIGLEITWYNNHEDLK